MKTIIINRVKIISAFIILFFAMNNMAEGVSKTKSTDDDTKNVKEFSGKIIDSETKKPIIFV